MIDQDIGKRYEHLLCDRCKEKIKKEMEKVKRQGKFKQAFIMANPNRFAVLLQKKICKKCRKAIMEDIQNETNKYRE